MQNRKIKTRSMESQNEVSRRVNMVEGVRQTRWTWNTNQVETGPTDRKCAGRSRSKGYFMQVRFENSKNVGSYKGSGQTHVKLLIIKSEIAVDFIYYLSKVHC